MRNWKRLLLRVGFAACLLGLAACDSDGFQGQVYERTAEGGVGPAIASAAITFVSEDGSTSKNTTSNESGYYRLSLDPGRYVVSATQPEYEAFSTAPGFFVVTGNGYQTGNIFMEKPAVTTVLLVRHAEKASAVPNTNLDADAANTGIGVTRAQALAPIAANANVVAVYTTSYCRTAQTAQPSALQLGHALRVLQTTDPNAGLANCNPAINAPQQQLAIGAPAALAQQVLTQHAGQTVLIVGHSNTVPELVEALGAPSLCPTYFPLSANGNCYIPENQYDNLFTVTVPVSGGAIQVTRQQYGVPS